MDLLGQRTHCGPNVAPPNPRQPYLGDFTADGLDHLTLCSQSPGFGTQAAPVQVVAPGGSDGGDFTADGLDQLTLCSQSPGFGTPAAPVQPNGLQTVALCPIWRPSAPSTSLLFQEVAPGDSDGGDFTADGFEQLTLCSQSPGFGTPAAPVQQNGLKTLALGFFWRPSPPSASLLFQVVALGDSDGGDFTADGLDQLTLCSQSPGFGTPAAPVKVVAPGDSDGGDFTADGLDQLTLCSQSPGFGTPAAPVQVVAPFDSDGGDFTADGLDQLTLCSQSPGFGTPAAPVQRPSPPSTSLLFQVVAPGDSDGGDFTADGLDQLTLCSQSPSFGTPAAPVQVLFKETESGQSTRVSKLTIISPDTERK
ncbi:hypothetical protein STEG23_018093 [Scotinomys teguina]